MIRVTEARNSTPEKRYMEIAGLSTDTKPTTNMATGSIFVEVDTGTVFFFDEDGNEWVEQFSFQG